MKDLRKFSEVKKKDCHDPYPLLQVACDLRLCNQPGYYQPGGPIFLCIDGEDNPWLPSLPARHLMLGCSLHQVRS